MDFFSSVFGSRPNYSNVKSPYQQVQALAPNLPKLTSYAANDIYSELQGQLPADVMNQIKNAGAAWGVKSGMPGSMAAQNVTLESLGLNTFGEQQKGQADYINFLTGTGSQMMPVGEQVMAANAAAAPNPVSAGLWNTGMGILGTFLGGELSGGSGWTKAPPANTAYSGGGGGGSSSYSMAPFSGFDTSSLYGGVGPSSSPFNIDSLYGY